MSTAIFILGVGNLGKYLAYTLCHNIPRPIFTLLFHRPGLADDFKAAGFDISCTSDGKTHSIGPFGAEILDDSADKSLDWSIRHLIVATKAPATLAALKPIAHRLDQKTNIVLVQNGMGEVIAF
jgi:2-dehydropantoate 2-reductase